MPYFYAYDGDHVGRYLEYLVLSNDESGITEFSRQATSTVETLVTELKKHGCTIVFFGGDSVLAKSSDFVDVEALPRQFGKIRFSLGIGTSPRRAMLGLKKAKALGTGLCVHFSEADV